MDQVHYPPQVAISLITWCLAVSMACDASLAATWESIPSLSGTVTIEPDTLGPSSQISGALSVWVRYSPSLSVDCSPPRGCYASTQRIRYDFNCMPRYATIMERTSFDLNGAVIKHEVSGSYAASNDEAANRVLTKYCGSRDRD
jgi:hypothetical protein